MLALSSCEIIDELKKLGIEMPSDVVEYMEEYTAYCSGKSCSTCTAKD